MRRNISFVVALLVTMHFTATPAYAENFVDEILILLGLEDKKKSPSGGIVPNVIEDGGGSNDEIPERIIDHFEENDGNPPLPGDDEENDLPFNENQDPPIFGLQQEPGLPTTPEPLTCLLVTLGAGAGLVVRRKRAASSTTDDL